MNNVQTPAAERFPIRPRRPAPVYGNTWASVSKWSNRNLTAERDYLFGHFGSFRYRSFASNPKHAAIILCVAGFITVVWLLGIRQIVAIALTAAIIGLAVVWTLVRIAKREPPGPTTIAVGADGLNVEYPSYGEFIPIRKLRRVKYADATVTVNVRGRAPLSVELLNAEHASVFCRLANVAKACLDSAQNDLADHLLVGDSDSLHEKINRLVVGDAGRADYRQQALDGQALVRLLGAPTAKPSSRVAAAAALKLKDPERALTLIRQASQSTVNHPLRTAFEQLAAGKLDEKQIDEADQWHRGR